MQHRNLTLHLTVEGEVVEIQTEHTPLPLLFRHEFDFPCLVALFDLVLQENRILLAFLLFLTVFFTH